MHIKPGSSYVTRNHVTCDLVMLKKGSDVKIPLTFPFDTAVWLASVFHLRL